MHEHISPIMDAEWEPAQTYVNPYHCADPVEYHRRVMRRAGGRRSAGPVSLSALSGTCSASPWCFTSP